jgi:hypothetical protein
MKDTRTIDFLGSGLAFPVAAGPGGELNSASAELKIQQAIWIILATAPGERVMRPEFGCGIHRLVFSINDAATLNNAVEEVKKALVRWEPRIDLVDVAARSRRGSEMLINIRYRVRSTNNLFNLVYPFYLGGSPD